jgi:hypothetical protein
MLLGGKGNSPQNSYVVWWWGPLSFMCLFGVFPSMECKLSESRVVYLYSKCLEQCLDNSRHSKNAC